MKLSQKVRHHVFFWDTVQLWLEWAKSTSSISQVLGTGADPGLSSQPAGDSCIVMNAVVGCHHLPPGPQQHTCIVMNPGVGCFYFPPGPHLGLPSQPPRQRGSAGAIEVATGRPNGRKGAHGEREPTMGVQRAEAVSVWAFGCPKEIIHLPTSLHRHNNRRGRGRLVPLTFRFYQCIGPQLLGRSFQKAKNFTAISIVVTRMQDLASEFSKNFPGVIRRTLTAGGGDPLPHPTPSLAFGQRPGAPSVGNLVPLNFSAVVAPLLLCILRIQ